MMNAIKRILEKNKNAFVIIVENNKPMFVVTSFDEYEKNFSFANEEEKNFSFADGEERVLGSLPIGSQPEKFFQEEKVLEEVNREIINLGAPQEANIQIIEENAPLQGIQEIKVEDIPL